VGRARKGGGRALQQSRRGQRPSDPLSGRGAPRRFGRRCHRRRRWRCGVGVERQRMDAGEPPARHFPLAPRLYALLQRLSAPSKWPVSGRVQDRGRAQAKQLHREWIVLFALICSTQNKLPYRGSLHLCRSLRGVRAAPAVDYCGAMASFGNILLCGQGTVRSRGPNCRALAAAQRRARASSDVRAGPAPAWFLSARSANPAVSRGSAAAQHSSNAPRPARVCANVPPYLAVRPLVPPRACRTRVAWSWAARRSRGRRALATRRSPCRWRG
jgi:hypothetical protein